jgi:signal transduction histidine kinase
VVTPLEAPGGEVAGVLCTVQIDRDDDPVALRRHLGYEHGLRVAAERAGRAQGALLGAISHSLRSPLNALRGWTDLLARASPADQGLQERAAAALARGVAQQTQLLNDIADAFLLVDGGLELDFQPVHLAAVVQRGVELAQESAAARGVSLACFVETPATVASVRGDAQRLAQVVRHLLANAIRFTPAGGAVTATVSLAAEFDTEREHVLLDVRDTGAGIAAEDLPFVLARFGPDERAGTRSSGGVGLGLFLVRRLVELHHGIVAVASEGTGRGARFQVRIPRGC